jgi:hypothetical protein
MRQAIVLIVAALAAAVLAAPAAGAAQPRLATSHARVLTESTARIAAAALPGREAVEVGRCARRGAARVRCAFTLRTREMRCRATVTVARRPSGRLRVSTGRTLCAGRIAAPRDSAPGGVPADELALPEMPRSDAGLMAPPAPDSHGSDPGHDAPVGTSPSGS